MQLLTKGPQGSLELSRGKAFQAKYKSATKLPATAEAQIEFFDHASNTLALVEGEVSGREIIFKGYPEDLDSVPAGSPWEFSIANDEGEWELKSTGEVVRWEARFPLEEIPTTETLAQLYQDNFNRSFLGARWVKIRGSVRIWDNIGSLPNGMGANNILFTNSAARWHKPLTGDDVTIQVSLLYGGDGASRICFASNSTMTSWIGVEFRNGLGLDHWRIVTGSSPTTVTMRDQAAYVTATGDVATIKFNSLTRTVQVFKNGATDPILEWTDISEEMPIGPGFQYLGASFSASLLSTGPQFTAFTAKDGI